MLSLCGLILCFMASGQVPERTAPTALESAPGPEIVPDYEIGPEDILKVTVFGHQDLDQVVIVQPDGTFMFPLIGNVKASNLTLEELVRKLTTLLSAYVRSPQVTVAVQEFRSKVVRVVGAVAKPGTYPIARGATLMEILSAAGPLTSEAGATAVVVRPKKKVAAPPVVEGEEALVEGAGAMAGGDDEAASAGDEGASAEGEEGLKSAPAESPNVVLEIDLRELDAGNLEKNLTLLPNDTVIVPKAPKVYVSGEVENPGAYAFSPGLTVRQLISMAGGLTRRGSSGRLRIVRTIGGESKQVKTKIDSAVRPGDTLIVKSKLF
jgi:polysaccharide export outer membrane protein